MIKFVSTDGKKKQGSSKTSAKPKTRKKVKAKSKRPAPAKAKSASKPAAEQKADPSAKPAQAEAPAQEKRKGNSGPDRKGGTPFKLTDVAQVIEVLRACGGIKTIAADRLKVGRTTLYRFIDDHPEVGEALAEIDASILDVAEAQVVKAINAGDMQTVRWFLETKGKDRGFTRRVENTGKGGGPVEVAQKMDLSQCSDEELEILMRAAEKRESASAGK